MPERLQQRSARGRLLAVFHAHLESNGEYFRDPADRRLFWYGARCALAGWAGYRLYGMQCQPIPKRAVIYRNCLTMIKEEDVLAALDKPRAVYGLQQRLDPSNKSTDALQDLLMRMRTAGTVKFDIKTGKWSKA